MGSKKKPVPVPPDGIFVYIGPTIRGVIATAAIFRGTRESVLARLATEISAYPEIERLIVADSDVSAARKKVKHPGNAVHRAYADVGGKLPSR